MRRYLERMEQAEETLRRLREFYSEENDLLDLYLQPQGRLDIKDISNFMGGDREAVLRKTRNLINFKVRDRQGNEDPLRSLRRIKKSIEYRSGYDLDFTLRKVEEYYNTSEEEKERIRLERARKLLGKIRKRNFESKLESWVNSAEPILAEIIENSSENMNGFHYSSQYHPAGGSFADSTTDKEILSKGKKLYTLEIESSWGAVYKKEYEDGSEKLAHKTLMVIDPKNVTYSNKSNYNEEDYPYTFIHKFNKLRNDLVREIEKRTGRNLKREVYEARRRREEQ